MNILRKLAFDKCSPQDWVTISSFLILMVGSVYAAVKNVSSEQSLKKKHNNVNLVASDLVFEGSTLKGVLPVWGAAKHDHSIAFGCVLSRAGVVVAFCAGWTNDVADSHSK